MPSKKEYLVTIRNRYNSCIIRAEKSAIITEVMVNLNILRKSAIRLINRKPFIRRKTLKSRKVMYGDYLIKPLQLLWNIAGNPCSNEITFKFFLDLWYIKYHRVLKERTVNPITKKWFYTHKQLRSAYRSLKNNLPFLFTYQKVKNMPNTTNTLDGFFAHLKDGVRIHRGLKMHRRTKLIEYLIVR